MTRVCLPSALQPKFSWLGSHQLVHLHQLLLLLVQLLGLHVQNHFEALQLLLQVHRVGVLWGGDKPNIMASRELNSTNRGRCTPPTWCTALWAHRATETNRGQLNKTDKQGNHVVCMRQCLIYSCSRYLTTRGQCVTGSLVLLLLLQLLIGDVEWRGKWEVVTLMTALCQGRTQSPPGSYLTLMKSGRLAVRWHSGKIKSLRRQREDRAVAQRAKTELSLW